MFAVYVIKSESTDKIYVGQTEDWKTRLRRHNKELLYNPKSNTAKNKGPWKVIYNKETYKTRLDTTKREKYLKSHVGRDYIRSVIKGV